MSPPAATAIAPLTPAWLGWPVDLPASALRMSSTCQGSSRGTGCKLWFRPHPLGTSREGLVPSRVAWFTFRACWRPVEQCCSSSPRQAELWGPRRFPGLPWACGLLTRPLGRASGPPQPRERPRARPACWLAGRSAQKMLFRRCPPAPLRLPLEPPGRSTWLSPQVSCWLRWELWRDRRYPSCHQRWELPGPSFWPRWNCCLQHWRCRLPSHQDRTAWNPHLAQAVPSPAWLCLPPGLPYGDDGDASSGRPSCASVCVEEALQSLIPQAQWLADRLARRPRAAPLAAGDRSLPDSWHRPPSATPSWHSSDLHQASYPAVRLPSSSFWPQWYF